MVSPWQERIRARREQNRIGAAILLAQVDTIAAVDALVGAADGVASLDGDGKLPASQLPDTAVIDASGFTGVLMGSGVTNLQELAEWLDANL